MTIYDLTERPKSADPEGQVPHPEDEPEEAPSEPMGLVDDDRVDGMSKHEDVYGYSHPDLGVQYLRGDPDREPAWFLWADYTMSGFLTVTVLVVGIVFAPIWVPFALIGWVLNRATKEDEE